MSSRGIECERIAESAAKIGSSSSGPTVSLQVSVERYRYRCPVKPNSLALPLRQAHNVFELGEMAILNHPVGLVND
jgi:hypothetical protein